MIWAQVHGGQLRNQVKPRTKPRVAEITGSSSLTVKASLPITSGAQRVRKDLDKASALAWGCYQKTLRERLEAQTGFEEAAIKNHVELLLAIKKHALHSEDPEAWALDTLGTCAPRSSIISSTRMKHHLIT